MLHRRCVRSVSGRTTNCVLHLEWGGVRMGYVWGAGYGALWASGRTILTEIGLPELAVSGCKHQIRKTTSDSLSVGVHVGVHMCLCMRVSG